MRAALADDLDAPRALRLVDRWAERVRRGHGDDPSAPDLVADMSDALLGVDLRAATDGEFPFGWQGSAGARFGLLPKGGENGDIRWFDVSNCYMFHSVNAYEVGDRVEVIGGRAEDAALMLQAMAGFDERDSTSVERPVEDYTTSLNKSLQGMKIGVPKEYFGAGLDAAVADAIETALAEYRKLGATQLSKLAEMLTLLQTARLLAYRAAWMAGAGDREAGVLALCAKVFASESAERVASQALQILGAHGYLRGNPAEEGYRNAKYLQIAGTSSEISRMKIGDALAKRNVAPHIYESQNEAREALNNI